MYLGSPPHMRGTLDIRLKFKRVFRITPAYAGNTVREARQHRRRQDHPRICGEHSLIMSTSTSISGSPPHMRGTLYGWKIYILQMRITPAYAGNTVFSHTNVNFLQDHPRICGEHGRVAEFSNVSAGSPPHMRGTRLLPLFLLRSYRITPAYAGNT